MAVVVSHIADQFPDLARAALRQAPLADVIELRLDRIGNPGEAPLAEFIRAAKKPVIVACHGPAAFGEFEGSVEEHFDILRTAARAGATFVDVDATLALDFGPVEGKCHRIVSRHWTEGTPEDLEAFHDEVTEVLDEGDLVKLCTFARDARDGMRMLNHVRQVGGGLIGFCAGEAGSFTRVLAPIFGSPFTYAAPAEIPGEPVGSPTAPGQLRVNDLLGILPPGGVTPETAVFAVIGDRVRHSWSPRVHGMALKAAQLDAVYVALESDDWEGLFSLCTDENLRGLSVTAPFKEHAHRSAHTHDAGSTACGATNTLVRDPKGWQSFNTDVPSIRRVLEQGFEERSGKVGGQDGMDSAVVLVLGAGGAARAVVQAVLDVGGHPLVAARRKEAAEQLVASLPRGNRARVVDFASIPDESYDALVNATPVGSEGYDPGEWNGLPMPADWVRPGTVVLDAVYRPVATPLLRTAKALDCVCVPGGEWFVRQAADQFQLFTHQEPDDAVLRGAFHHAVAETRG